MAYLSAIREKTSQYLELTLSESSESIEILADAEKQSLRSDQIQAMMDIIKVGNCFSIFTCAKTLSTTSTLATRSGSDSRTSEDL